MNKMKILVTYAGIWKSDTGSTGLTLNYFMYGDNGDLMISRVDATGGPVGQQRAKANLQQVPILILQCAVRLLLYQGFMMYRWDLRSEVTANLS